MQTWLISFEWHVCQCIFKAVVKLCFSKKIGNREKVALCESSDLWGCEVTVGRKRNCHQGRTWEITITHTLRGRSESCGLLCWRCLRFSDCVKQGTNPNLIFLSLQCLIALTPFAPVDIEIPSVVHNTCRVHKRRMSFFLELIFYLDIKDPFWFKLWF